MGKISLKFIGIIVLRRLEGKMLLSLSAKRPDSDLSNRPREPQTIVVRMQVGEENG